MRAICVRNQRSLVGNHGITHIFHREIRIFFRGWSHLSDNRIFETDFLKDRLPQIYSLNEIRLQKFGGIPVNIENDRFYRFNQFSTFIFFHIFRFRFQSPTTNKIRPFSFIRISSHIRFHVREVSHPDIFKPGSHGFLRQEGYGHTDFPTRRRSWFTPPLRICRTRRQ